MRLEAVVFVVVVVSASAEEASRTANSVTSPRGIIKDLLQRLIEEFQGEKIKYFENIEITKDARFDNVTVHSIVDDIHLNMMDNLPTIYIKNLTVPVELVRVNGHYNFQDFTLPGGLVIYGNGEFKIAFDKLRLSLLFKARYKSNVGGWIGEDMALDASLIKSFVEFDNLMNGEPMGDFIHKMINEMIPVLVDLASGLVAENKTHIMKIICDLIGKILNGEKLF